MSFSSVVTTAGVFSAKLEGVMVVLVDVVLNVVVAVADPKIGLFDGKEPNRSDVNLSSLVLLPNDYVLGLVEHNV